MQKKSQNYQQLIIVKFQFFLGWEKALDGREEGFNPFAHGNNLI